MAKARPTVSDMSSQEFDELRRQFNNLLVILERNAREEADTTTSNVTAAEALASALETGLDGDTTNHVGTNKELNGVKPTPLHPRRARDQRTVNMDDSSDF